MLDIDVCERCLMKAAPHAYRGGIGKDWIKLSRLISCEIDNSNPRLIKIEGNPPADCPYKLEHGVSEAMNNNES